MKHFITFLFLIISLNSFSQSPEILFEEYSPYMIAKNLNDRIISLDSIHKFEENKNYGLTNRFIVTEKDSFDNIINAKLHVAYIYSPINKDLTIQYFDKDHIKSYLVLSDWNNEIDTSDYYEFDIFHNKLIEQHRYSLFCVTGYPNDEYKLKITYDQTGKIINKKEKIKWNYECGTNRPYNIWVTANSREYFYESNQLVKEIHYSNYFDERESFVNMYLLPYTKTMISYQNGKKDSVINQKWDLQNSLWINSQLKKYNYENDSTIIINYRWDESLSKWKNDIQIIKYTAYGKENIIQKNWNKSKNTWEFYYSRKYEYSGDTLIETEQWKFIKYKRFFLFDNKGKLYYSCRKKHQDSIWIKTNEKFLDYDNYSNPVKISYFSYRNQDTSKNITQYFWHTRYKDPNGYIPMLQEGNQWNILTIDDELRPGHTETTWTTTKLRIEDLSILREDTIERKVYIVENNKESVLYDFAMQLGDTLAYYYPDTSLGIRFTLRLDSIRNTVFENGKPTRKYFLSIKMPGNSQYSGTVYWLEGMGSPEGPIPYKTIGYTGDFKTSFLLCFKQYDELLYMVHDYDSCDENYTETQDFTIEEPIIFPNPVGDYLRFSADTNFDWKYITILDMFGKKVFSKNISGYNQSKIDISILPPGTYVLKIADITGKHIVLKKFIKM